MSSHLESCVRLYSIYRVSSSLPYFSRFLCLCLQNCAIGSADRLDCPSPNISSTWQSVTPEKPLVVYISFLMDGVENLRNPKGEKPLWSRFEYYPNPIFYNFEGGLKQLYNEEEHLAIQVCTLGFRQTWVTQTNVHPIFLSGLGEIWIMIYSKNMK